eukprot:6483283-Amphidinium_carterae.2
MQQGHAGHPNLAQLIAKSCPITLCLCSSVSRASWSQDRSLRDLPSHSCSDLPTIFQAQTQAEHFKVTCQLQSAEMKTAWGISRRFRTLRLPQFFLRALVSHIVDVAVTPKSKILRVMQGPWMGRATEGKQQ